MRVKRIDEKLMDIQKPRMSAIEKLDYSENDYLVVAAGFEERSLSILRRIKKDHSNLVLNIFLIEYAPTNKHNKIDEAKNLCVGHNTKIIEYDRFSPSAFGEIVFDNITNTNKSVFIDVTALSRFLIVQLVVAAAKKRKLINTNILYTEALQYSPTQKEVEKTLNRSSKSSHDQTYRGYFLSAGVSEIIAVSELSSIEMSSQPIRLLAFPSFNPDQLLMIKNEIVPSFIHLIHGTPPRQENKWRKKAIKQLNSFITLKDSTEKSVCTLNYKETLIYLLKVYRENCCFDKLVVAPTGSKMQSVAIGLFRAFLKDVQIVYPIPRDFDNEKKYTIGMKEIHQLNLNGFSKIIE
jgi:hypothetical protein